MPFNATTWRATSSMKKAHLFLQSKGQWTTVHVGSLCGSYYYWKSELDHYRIDLDKVDMNEDNDKPRCKNCLRVQLARERKNEK